MLLLFKKKSVLSIERDVVKSDSTRKLLIRNRSKLYFQAFNAPNSNLIYDYTAEYDRYMVLLFEREKKPSVVPMRRSSSKPFALVFFDDILFYSMKTRCCVDASASKLSLFQHRIEELIDSRKINKKIGGRQMRNYSENKTFIKFYGTNCSARMPFPQFKAATCSST